MDKQPSYRRGDIQICTKALRQAIEIDPRMAKSLPSTKGTPRDNATALID